MLMFAMTCLRLGNDNEVLRVLQSGRCGDAVQLALSRLETRPAPAQLAEHAALGQVIGRLMIHMGRATEAEELFRRQLRVYELGSRAGVRRLSALDRGVVLSVMNKPSQSAQAYAPVADDEAADPMLRIEALCGVAASARLLGDYRRARHALQCARDLASHAGLSLAQHLVDAMLLEAEVMQQVCAYDEGSDHLARAAAPTSQLPLTRRLSGAAKLLAAIPLAASRVRFLATLVDTTNARQQLEGQIDYISELRVARLVELERAARIEAALSQLVAGNGRAAKGLLGSLAQGEDAVRRQRHCLALRYCLSGIHATEGRHADALRLYKEHVMQSIGRLHSELPHMPSLRCLERRERADLPDPAKVLLPLKYRRAYQYIIDHLDSRDLSVREVAAHESTCWAQHQGVLRDCATHTILQLASRRCPCRGGCVVS